MEIEQNHVFNWDQKKLWRSPQYLAPVQINDLTPHESLTLHWLNRQNKVFICHYHHFCECSFLDKMLPGRLLAWLDQYYQMKLFHY